MLDLTVNTCVTLSIFSFASATPCLFVFDCIYYNGKSLLNMAIKDRRKLLLDHMKEVDNHVKFSEAKVSVAIFKAKEISW